MTIDPTDSAGSGGAAGGVPAGSTHRAEKAARPGRTAPHSSVGAAGQDGPPAAPHRPRPPSTDVDGPVASLTGTTTFSEEVVAKIVGTAAEEVPGIHGLGEGRGAGRGVHVEVGRRQVAADLDVVVEYAVSVPEVAAAVRARVVAAVGGMTGLEVVEVNLRVTDVHLPQDDLPSDGSGRRVV
jgi:uncharacterized alkaline shock family protein YloU